MGSMSTFSNVLLLAIFVGMAVWMVVGYVKTHDKVEIKDFMWTGNRIIFAIAGALALVSAFMFNNLWDYLRLISMVVAIVMFLLMRDGIGPDGVVSMGKFTPYEDVKAYDFQAKKKRFEVYFTCAENKDGKNDYYNLIIDFDLKDEEKIKAYLKEKIGRKYTRMKKD